MADRNNEHVTRRDFLKLGVSVTAGAVVPPMLAACGGGGSSDALPKETFVEPLNIQSVNGVLDVTLVLSYLTTTLPDATGKKQTVTLRNMYGTIPAPTLRMRVGDLLSFFAAITRVGRTSVTVQVEVYAERRHTPQRYVKVTEARLTYVAIGDDGRPRLVQPAAAPATS